MCVSFVWCALDCVDTINGVTANDACIITVQFGEGFLHDSSPNRVVFTNCGVESIKLLSAEALSPEREAIINGHGDGYVQQVQL